MSKMRFEQEIEGQSIVVLCSIWSGREQVWLDGELVSDRHSWRMRTRHTVELKTGLIDVVVSVDSWRDCIILVNWLRGELSLVQQRKGLFSDEVAADPSWVQEWRIPVWCSVAFWFPFGCLFGFNVMVWLLGGDAALVQLPLAIIALVALSCGLGVIGVWFAQVWRLSGPSETKPSDDLSKEPL
ncbi:hypothetical protein GCM10023333_29810 [Ferrimonas pelagia]|uniref:Transmembrane protein n=2 Tax=Ferrimonas pelagia TaxID=1177826 RepID=A0ABP9F6Z2_9GAMM